MKNFKINTNRPPLTDAELSAKADFSQLLKSYQAAKTPFFKTPRFMFGASAILVAGVAALIVYMQLNNTGQPGNAFINPPVAAANIQPESFTIDAGSDSNITYKSGSKIHIPANAFLDENGQPAKGLVELKYREFHKVSEVFLAGIPMTYDSAGEEFHFETAGMMEIAAMQNGRPLTANPNALITVDMVSGNSEDKFNTYYLDTVEKKWKYLAQTNYKQPIASTQAKQPDSLPINPQAAYNVKDEPLKNTLLQIENNKKEIAQLEQQKPVEPKAVNSEKHRFTIRVDEKEFPEIAIYSNMKFQVEDKNYDAKKAQVQWDNVEMKRIEKSLNYLITFSNAKESYQVVATPVFAEKDIKEAQKIYDSKYREYEARLSKRKADEAALKAELEARAKQVEEKIQKEIAEQAERRRAYEARLSQSNLVFRTFQVADFGIWNCDCPNRLPTGANVIAQLSDAQTKQKLSIQYCYLIEKGRNAMFTYYPQAMNNFRFNPAKENMIWAVTSDLKVAFMKPDAFRAAQKQNGQMELELTVIGKDFKSTDEVKEYLEI